MHIAAPTAQNIPKIWFVWELVCENGFEIIIIPIIAKVIYIQALGFIFSFNIIWASGTVIMALAQIMTATMAGFA